MKRRRIFGDWTCVIDGEERRINLQQGKMTMVTAHGCMTGMDYSIDWQSKPPILSRSYLDFTIDNESYQPLDVCEAGKSVTTWTTAYACRFLSDNELQLAPPGANFAASNATKHPLYKRNVCSESKKHHDQTTLPEHRLPHIQSPEH